MGIHQQIGIAPMPALARILSRFDRATLESFLTVAVELLDTLDGDPDFENATDLEDDHALSPHASGYPTGPGCEVSDTGEEDDDDSAVDDKPCDEPWQDLEEEQMQGDVPTVPCFAIEPRQDGKRAFVGYWNPGSLHR